MSRDVAALDLDAARQRPLRRPDAGRYRPVRGLHARPARSVLRGARTSARVGALPGVSGPDVGVDPHRRRSVRRQHDRVPARLLPRAGRARLGCRHRRGIPRRPDRPGAPPRPQLSSHRRAGGGALPPIGARPHRRRRRRRRRRRPDGRGHRRDVPHATRSVPDLGPQDARSPRSNSRVTARPRNAPHASSCSRMSRSRRDGRRRHAGPVCVSLKRPYRRGSSMPGRCQ